MCNILVVDDDPILCDLMEAVLSDEGHEVRRALNGADALVMARQHQPDLIITDVRMPHQNGASFIESYRQLPEAHARVVVVSGVTGLGEEAARLKADAFVQKPFDLDTLLSTVEQAFTAVA
jgi:CheY-like chemotaxis protein